jgi:aryl-alcohol dehydrogenase-like predicted oxidoreductase
MKYSSIPGASDRVSRLILGTNTFTLEIAATAFDVLDAFVAAGGTAIDTAHVYRNGESEQVVGRWLRARGNHEGLVLTTKGAHPKVDMRDPFAADWSPRVNPTAIAEDLAESLERLGVNSVDLYFLHRDDPTAPVGPIVECLNEQRETGRIGAFAASNWSHQRIQEANDFARARGLNGFVASSPQLSLARWIGPTRPGTLSISGDQAALDWYAEQRVAVVAWSSQAAGFFARDYLPGSPDLSVRQRNYDRPDNWERWRRVRKLAAHLGATPAQVALAWVLSQPFETYAAIGTSNVHHLADSLGALDVCLSPADVTWLDLQDVDAEITNRRISA